MDILTPSSLPPALRAAIAYQEFAAGQALFHQGDQTVAFFVVETGRVRLTRYTSEGKVQGELTLRWWVGETTSEWHFRASPLLS